MWYNMHMESPVIARCISRYNVERLIRKVDQNTYIVEGETLFTRGTTDGTMADFEGGPYIEVDMSARLVGIPDNRSIESVKFLDTDKENYAMVEVTVKQKQTI